MCDLLVTRVRRLRVANPDLGLKLMIVKLREQQPDLVVGHREVREAMKVLNAETVSVNEGGAPSHAALACVGCRRLPSDMSDGRKIHPDICKPCVKLDLAKAYWCGADCPGGAAARQVHAEYHKRVKAARQVPQCNKPPPQLSGEDWQCVGALRQALAQRPDEPGAYYNLGVALTRSGNYTEAEQRFLEAKDLYAVGSQDWKDAVAAASRARSVVSSCDVWAAADGRGGAAEQLDDRCAGSMAAELVERIMAALHQHGSTSLDLYITRLCELAECGPTYATAVAQAGGAAAVVAALVAQPSDLDVAAHSCAVLSRIAGGGMACAETVVEAVVRSHAEGAVAIVGLVAAHPREGRLCFYACVALCGIARGGAEGAQALVRAGAAVPIVAALRLAGTLGGQLERSAVAVLGSLAESSAEGASAVVVAGGVPAIGEAMQGCLRQPKAISRLMGFEGFRALGSLARAGQPCTLIASGATRAVVAVMRAHAGNEAMASAGCAVLRDLAGGGTACASAVAKAGGAAAVVAAVEEHRMAVTMGCDALVRIAADGAANAQIVAAAGGCRAATAAAKHSEECAVSAAALQRLCDAAVAHGDLMAAKLLAEEAEERAVTENEKRRLQAAKERASIKAAARRARQDSAPSSCVTVTVGAPTPPATSGANTPGVAAGAAAGVTSPGEERQTELRLEAENPWLYHCKAGTPVSHLFIPSRASTLTTPTTHYWPANANTNTDPNPNPNPNQVSTILFGLGLNETTTRVLELDTANFCYTARGQLQAESAVLLALAEGSSRGAAPPPVAARGQFWPTVRNQLARLVEDTTLLVLRGAWPSQHPGCRAGNPAGRGFTAHLFVDCVSLAYDDASRACKAAQVIAVVVEGGGTGSIQGRWSDGSSFEHAVAEL